MNTDNFDQKNIRNFSIIAHIDHGKSTLADRLLESTNSVVKRKMKDRLLDNMELERERGITIKAQTVCLNYKAANGTTYILNLVDTPGHVDFSYEVSRSLASCEGALLVVDASQGVQAQTLANVYMAIDNNLEILPVINKIDLPHADVAGVKDEIENIIGIDTDEAIEVSAKSGLGVEQLLEYIVHKVPPPEGEPLSPTQALVFDSWFDPYQGVIVLVRVINGTIRKGDKIHLKSSQEHYEILKMGLNTPFFQEVSSLSAGQIGMIMSGIKTVRDIKIGDTLVADPQTPALPGYEEVCPMVFCGVFPVESHDYENLKEALEKLSLNDASFIYTPETSGALGFGFRCGFLGLLHMDIVQERLEREFELNLISTAPSVNYQVLSSEGELLEISNPADLPESGQYTELREPIMSVTLHLPNTFIGNIIKLCTERRGRQTDMKYITPKRVQLQYDLPLSEIVYDFYDKLKSYSKGHASMDYEYAEHRSADLVKLDIKLNGENVDALSLICHRESAYHKGRDLTQRLQKLISRQQFDIAVQAAIGAKIIARETIKALRKNVLAKCYGGDITRKRKLLEKQKAGKKRMKMVGSVEIPQEAFLAILKVGDGG